MPDTSTKLGLSLPLRNEAVTRLAYRQNLEQIDLKAAAQDQADEPFFLKSAIYNSGLSRIDCTFGKGRAAFLGTLIVKNEDSTTQIPNPIPSTSYYLYIKNDGTYAFNTTGVQIAGGVQIWKVTTGTTVDQITKEDRRGELPGAAAKIVQDNLDGHNAAGDPHPQYALDSEKGVAGGIATLDAGGTIPDAQIPAAIARDSELAAHLNDTTPHGATSAATASRLMLRDAVGRAKVAAPSASDDIARKDTVDAHVNLTTAHGSTSAATASTIMQRDASGRAKVAAPSASDDIARKDTVDNHNTTQAHGASGSYYLAKTSRSDQLPAWNDIQSKPVSYTPVSHGNEAHSATFWHAGNDGAGSGLDADTVDGIHASGLSAWVLPGDTIFAESLSTSTENSTTESIKKRFLTSLPGRYRITLEACGENTAYIMVYVFRPNIDPGFVTVVEKVQVGSASTGSSSWVALTMDMNTPVSSSAVIAIGLRSNQNSYVASIRNVRLCGVCSQAETAIVL